MTTGNEKKIIQQPHEKNVKKYPGHKPDIDTFKIRVVSHPPSPWPTIIDPYVTPLKINPIVTHSFDMICKIQTVIPSPSASQWRPADLAV